MPIVLDETTRAQYLAQPVASTRATLVVGSLSGTVVVEVYDGFNVLRASGTMAAPWATASAGTITVGEVNASGLTVTSGGTPDANWYCQFRAGSRFVRGTFGVTGSGRDFTWSLPTFQTGSRGTIGTATLTAQGLPDTPVGTAGIVALAPTVVQLTWPAVGGTYIDIERSTDGVTFSRIAYRQQGALSYIDGTAQPATTYQYRVRPQGGNIHVDGTVTTPAVAAALVAPSNLVVTVNSAVQATLAWTLGPLRTEDFIEVQRSSDSGVTWTTVGRPFRGVARFKDLGLVASTAYQWRVRTVNAGGVSAWSGVVSGTTPSYAAGSVPAVPTMHSALGADQSRVSVQWTLNDETELGCVVEYSTNNGSTWTVGTVVPKHYWQTYVIGLATATSYLWRVRAFNASGYSTASGTTNGATLASGAVASPTGRNPRLHWTPQRQQTFAQMRADFLANTVNPATYGGRVYKYIKSRADLTGTAGQRYGDQGGDAAVMYQATGDATYATKAYNEIIKYGATAMAAGLPGNNYNFIREYIGDFVLWADWIYPALNSTQRETLGAQLKRYAEFVTATSFNIYAAGTRLGTPTDIGDDDQTSGHTWGICTLDAAATPDVPGAGWWGQEWCYSSNGNYPLGGIAPTGLDRATLVNTGARAFAEFFLGGEWFTSSQYNPGTMAFVASGLEGVRTARSYEGDNADYYPEMTQAVRDACRTMAYIATPNFTMPVQWGDDQNPRQWGGNGFANGRTGCAAMFAGICRGNPAGPVAAGMFESYWNLGAIGQEPSYRIFYSFDPYMPRTARSTLPAVSYARGVGQVVYQDGWGTNDSMYWGLFAKSFHVDHHFAPFMPYWGDFQLYRRGEWGITRPVMYPNYSTTVAGGGAGLLPQGQNVMGIAGMQGYYAAAPGVTNYDGFREVVAQQSGTGYVYTAGTTYGSIVRTNYYQRPPAYAYEVTRSLLYLASTTKNSDVIVVVDRTLASNPNFLPAYDGAPNVGLERYGTGLAAAINAAPALKAWYIHANVAPDVSAAGVSTWTTAGGQSARVEHLLPSGAVRAVVNESTEWGTPPGASEKKFHLIVRPATAWPSDATPTWDFFLNVVSVRHTGSVTSTLVQSSAGAQMAGALIARTGESDTLAMFSAVPSSRSGGVTTFRRLLTSGATFSWTQATASCVVRLFDLEPGRAWTYTLDGGGAQSLVVSSEGVTEITVSGATSHTFVLS